MEKVALALLMTVMVALAAPIGASVSAGGRNTDAGGIFVKGRPTPGLELPTIDGRSTVDMATLLGRKVIVLQFASW